jgi:hypothetical protein
MPHEYNRPRPSAMLRWLDSIVTPIRWLGERTMALSGAQVPARLWLRAWRRGRRQPRSCV